MPNLVAHSQISVYVGRFRNSGALMPCLPACLTISVAHANGQLDSRCS